MMIAGGNHTLIPRRGVRELGHTPWPASFVSFLPEQERYPSEVFARLVLKTIYCGINSTPPQQMLSTEKVPFPYEKIPFLRKKVIDLGGNLRYNMLA